MPSSSCRPRAVEMHKKMSAEATRMIWIFGRQLNVGGPLVVGGRVEVCPRDVDDHHLRPLLGLRISDLLDLALDVRGGHRQDRP